MENSVRNYAASSKVSTGNTLADALQTECAWGKTWNGADALTTTFDACLDLFGRAGAMRQSSVKDKQELFRKAFEEENDAAVKLLFYIRDIRGGYGERDTFNDMLVWLADNHPESVAKNLWAVLEYGRAKDLYSLIGTKAEADMWNFMKEQFNLDMKNMNNGKSVSLLAKWIATPDASSVKTAALGKKTAKHLGYDFKTMREYKKNLRALRKYLDIPEAKMCAGKWADIEYSKLASQCLIKHRSAFVRHDRERYVDFIDKASNGEVNMNTASMTPCDIIKQVETNYTPDLDVMWQNLEDICKGNALVICDTSGSMYGGHNSMKPIHVAIALSMYFAERNKGPIKDTFMTFSSHPQIVKIEGKNLREKYCNMDSSDWGYDTNLEAAFNKLLDICSDYKVPQKDMPDALVIVSDMQINCVHGISNNRITFYDEMKARYEAKGYKIPHVVFWNVNAANATFHASANDAGVSLVSGYSPSVFKAVMDNIGTNPLELMLSIINSDRYKEVRA